MSSVRSVVGRSLGVVALIAFLLAMLLLVTLLAFSVRVDGRSMEPTLHDGDRVVVKPFALDIERFDVIEAAEPRNGALVVKRVIGMPGDTVAIAGDDESPRVLLRPAGDDRTYAVRNPSWEGRTGTRVQSCCDDDGTVARSALTPRTVVVPDDAYWLIGDNWGGSDDSRSFGFFAVDSVQGEVVGRLMPVGDAGRIGPAGPRLEPADSADASPSGAPSG